MTAVRDLDEIHADLVHVRYLKTRQPTTVFRLAADVPALLARISELDQENARLTALLAPTSGRAPVAAEPGRDSNVLPT